MASIRAPCAAARAPAAQPTCTLTVPDPFGQGEMFVYGARTYYLMDEVGMAAAEYGRLAAAAHVPWQIKSLFGLLSDTVPLNGLHRSPYVLIAGCLGLHPLALCIAHCLATVHLSLKLWIRSRGCEGPCN